MSYAFDPSLPGVLAHLRRCREARAAGEVVGFTSDPAWLVDQAINRRAGWPQDPGVLRGTCAPLRDGRYPPRADGEELRWLGRLSRQLARRIVTRASECPKRYRARLAHRFFDDEE